MKTEYLNISPDNSKLILIMAGWATDRRFYSHIAMRGWDVAMISGYDDLSSVDDIPGKYHTIYLYAWSLGVCASRFLPFAGRITAAFAIAGTEIPAHDKFGIPIDIFKGTLVTLNIRNLLKFRKRMFDSSDRFNSISDRLPLTDDIDSLKAQLSVFLDISRGDMQNAGGRRNDLKWKRAYVTASDRIFPEQAQTDFWKQADNCLEIITLNSTHFVDINDIVRDTISDPEVIALKFSKAAPTYDNNALIQNLIAGRLADLLSKSDICSRENLKALEIGPGTGLFTKLWSEIIKTKRVDFIDITETKHFRLFENENYFKEDAEEWIMKCESKYDLVLSASAIQWFTNIPLFFKNIYSHLEDGGVMLVSSFLPGHFGQLDLFRPSPILYPDIESLREALSDFSTIEIFTERHEMNFNSTRDLLMHLKFTGVGGSSSTGQYSEILKSGINSLTYLPVYIIATK